MPLRMSGSPGSLHLLAAACAALAAGFVCLLTPAVQRAALHHGAAHMPRERDLHDQPEVIARPDAVTELIECECGAPDAAVSVRVAGATTRRTRSRSAM